MSIKQLWDRIEQWFRRRFRKRDKRPNPLITFTAEIDEMSNLVLNWTLPTTRILGEALPPEQIEFVEIQMSADGGVNYGGLSQQPPSVLTQTLTDVDPGTYMFRGIVQDTRGERSGDFDITSEAILSAPNPLESFTVTVE